MADLTDADKQSFITEISGVLKQAEIKSALTEKGFDPSQRATNLDNGLGAFGKADANEKQLEAARQAANELKRTLLEDNYKLASGTIGLVEGLLGRDHAVTRQLRQIRGGMNRETAPVTPDTQKP